MANDDERARPRADAAVPRVLVVWAAWSWRLLVVGAAAAIMLLVLGRLFVVVIPVVLALFLASVLEPPTTWLRNRRWPDAAAATVVFLAFLLVFGAVVAWIGTSVAGEFKDVGEQVREGIDAVEGWLTSGPLNLSQAQIAEFRARVTDAFRGGDGGLGRRLAGGARGATEVLGGFVLMLFTVFFVLKDGERMGRWIVGRTPPQYREEVSVLGGRYRFVMRRYLLATAATGAIDGILIGVALLVIGVPLVLPLAVLTFLGGFFPIVGATLAGLVAALVALVSGGFTKALLVIAVTVAVQQFEGNVLQPLILERAVRLHPLVTVWAVAAGLLVGGLTGAFLSVPLVAMAVATGSFYRARPARA